MNPNDGCTADCRVEATETEPNDVIAQANELVQPFYAEISPIGDSDIVELAVGTQPTVVEALELDSSACASGALDIQIEMLDATGTALLASDDDGGEGLCARLEVVGGGGCREPVPQGVRFVQSGLGDVPVQVAGEHAVDSNLPQHAAVKLVAAR
ncbi:MAG: hypothetical protein IPI67_19575 [Myxococcales bacterium]|nr:hypothetical protein [Myxococcales bacterium]